MGSKRKGKERENNSTYQLGDLDDEAKYEPNDPLTKKSTNLKNHSQWEYHLFPEEAGQTRYATTSTTYDEQAREYDQKQDHVSSKRSNETKCIGFAFVKSTGELCRGPCGVNLRTR